LNGARSAAARRHQQLALFERLLRGYGAGLNVQDACTVAYLARWSDDLNPARENIRARTGGFRTKDCECDFRQSALTASAKVGSPRSTYLEASRAFSLRTKSLYNSEKFYPQPFKASPYKPTAPQRTTAVERDIHYIWQVSDVRSLDASTVAC